MMKKNNKVKLNEEQEYLVSAIQSLKKGGRLVGSGRAGSGKTFAISRSVEGRRALFLAPTHPAKTILEQELAGTDHRVMTIQSAIGWRNEYDRETLKAVQTYRPASESKKGQSVGPFGDADVIVVDEASMVGKFLFTATEDYANEFGLPVVYSGDPFQLPPVEDEEVIHLQGFETITLDQSMRFPKDSSIFCLGEELRKSIKHHPNKAFGCLVGSGDVEVVNATDWTSALVHDYEKGANILAVTSNNRRQTALRAHVRGGENDQLRPGDTVISRQTDQLFRNGQILQVSKVEPGQKTLPDVPRCLGLEGELTVDGLVLTFADCILPAFVFADDSEREELRRRVKRLYGKKKLTHSQASHVLKWLDQINSFELSAFATVHKSQGRTVDTVYVDTASVLDKPDWLSVEHHKRLLYTSITRARKRVVLYKMGGLCEYSAEPTLAVAA